MHAMKTLAKALLLVLPFVTITLGIDDLAAMPFKDYVQFNSVDRESLNIYINGVGTGFSWANAMLNEPGSPKLYCQPPNLSLGTNNYVAILESQIIELKKAGILKEDTPIELILLLGLKKTFPCK